MDESCTHCGKMTILELRLRPWYFKRGGLPLPLPRFSSLPGKSRRRTTLGSSLGGLRIMLRSFPLRNQPPRAPSHALWPVELPGECGGPSNWSVPAVSFGKPLDSSWRCIRSLLGCGWHLLLPETGPVSLQFLLITPHRR